jgi:hypothetical protein
MDGTFSPIIQQFYSAVANDEMRSLNGIINYSINYHGLTLPVSMVAMEYDTLADPTQMKEKMFDYIPADKKFFICWNRIGHEDFFAYIKYFPPVLEAIRKVC